MNTLFSVSQAVKAICKNNGIAIIGTDKKTMFGHSNSKGLQGIFDQCLLSVTPTQTLESFMLKLAGNATSVKTTDTCQENQKKFHASQGKMIEKRLHNASHGVWKVWQKLQYLSGNSSKRDYNQLVSFFCNVNGDSKKACIIEIMAALQPLYKEMTEKRNELRSLAPDKVHCIEPLEVSTMVHDLKSKVKTVKEMNKAWEIFQAENQVPEISE